MSVNTQFDDVKFNSSDAESFYFLQKKLETNVGGIIRYELENLERAGKIKSANSITTLVTSCLQVQMERALAEAKVLK